MHKIHYHMCHTTIQGDSHTDCGKVVKTKFSSKIMDDVTCKACLRCLWALGKGPELGLIR